VLDHAEPRGRCNSAINDPNNGYPVNETLRAVDRVEHPGELAAPSEANSSPRIGVPGKAARIMRGIFGLDFAVRDRDRTAVAFALHRDGVRSSVGQSRARHRPVLGQCRAAGSPVLSEFRDVEASRRAAPSVPLRAYGTPAASSQLALHKPDQGLLQGPRQRSPGLWSCAIAELQVLPYARQRH